MSGQDDLDALLLELMVPQVQMPLALEAEAVAILVDDLAVAPAVVSIPADSVVQADGPELAGLAAIAAKRVKLEDRLHDLYLQLSSGRELLKRGLWSPEHADVLRGLERRIGVETMNWRCVDTEAWRWAYDADLIPAKPRPAGWSPFELLAAGSK